MPVEYREITGYPGYRVGDDGSIWSCRAMGRRRKELRHIPLIKGEWVRMNPTTMQNGYLIVTLRHDGRRRAFYVHRIVLEMFVGPCPAGMEACHFPDRNRANCTLSNLRWDTRSANALDRGYHGTSLRGERNHFAKLSDSKVAEARRRYKEESISHERLAIELNVSRPTISDAIRGDSWKHVAMDY